MKPPIVVGTPRFLSSEISPFRKVGTHTFFRGFLRRIFLFRKVSAIAIEAEIPKELERKAQSRAFL
ncbi:hypothetical protein DLM75_19515 [Leptospira stimsonii]|uniref:Uncharacterized protein n=1 Tax=Leptospira stimsonii TaxID=2202203 RepID=A0A396YR70_9LEPT|nr:hypothetical protein DLM75_19515 [Leptospira stimsonii]